MDFDSELEHLFKSNIPPSDLEIIRLRDLLRHEQRRMVDAVCRLEKEQIQARVELYKLALSPARRLALELVLEIFSYVSPSPTVFPLYHMEPMLILTQICSGWRTVALGFPRLWSDIVIHPPSDPTRFGSIIESTKAWFNRAHPIALTLQVGSAEYGDSWEESLQKVDITSEILIPNATQFRELILYMSSTSYQSFLRLATPVLDSSEPSYSPEDIRTAEWSDEPPSAITSTLTALKSSENLNLYIRGLPWHQMTGLFLPKDLWLSVTDIHSVLRQCTNLVNCTFDFCNKDTPERDIHIPKIVLSDLRQLKIFFWNGNTSNPSEILETLLRPLHLPALADLEFCPDVNFLSSDLPLTSLILQSRCNLERLHLILNMPGASRRALLKLTPSLLDLSITWGFGEVETLTLMTRNELVTELRTVWFVSFTYDLEGQNGWHPSEFDMALSAFVRSRSRQAMLT